MKAFCNRFKSLKLDLLFCYFSGKVQFCYDYIILARSSRSVGCAVQEVAGLIFSPATSFVEIWSWNNFIGLSLPTADSNWAAVSYWRKYEHLVLVNRLGNLPGNTRLDMKIVLTGPKNLTANIILCLTSIMHVYKIATSVGWVVYWGLMDMSIILLWYELHRDKTNKMAFAPRVDSDQPGHLPSLISLCCALNG